MNGRRMAQRAYYATVEAAAKQQRTIMEITMLRQLFGEDAIPPETVGRNLTTLATATETLARRERYAREGLQENLEAIREMEEHFRRAEESELQAFAESVRANRKAKV